MGLNLFFYNTWGWPYYGAKTHGWLRYTTVVVLSLSGRIFVECYFILRHLDPVQNGGQQSTVVLYVFPFLGRTYWEKDLHIAKGLVEYLKGCYSICISSCVGILVALYRQHHPPNIIICICRCDSHVRSVRGPFPPCQ